MDQPRTRPDARVPPRLVDGGADLAGRLGGAKRPTPGSTRPPAPGRAGAGCGRRPRRRARSPACSPTSRTPGCAGDRAHTRAGDRHRGLVQAVGADFVALDADTRPGSEVYVALVAVASVRGGPGGAEGGGRPPGRAHAAPARRGGGAGGRREHVRLVATGGEAVAGVVRSVGRDVVVVEARARGAGVAYVPLGALDEIVVTG